MRIAAKLTAVLTLLGLGVWAGTTFSPSTVNAQETLTFRVKDKKVVFSGGHAGDTYTFHQALKRNGEKVGVQELLGATTQRSGKGGQNMFTGVARVPGGRIMWVAGFHFVPRPQNFTGAIVGGVGRYEGAEGTVLVDQKKHGSVMTFRIR